MARRRFSFGFRLGGYVALAVIVGVFLVRELGQPAPFQTTYDHPAMEARFLASQYGPHWAFPTVVLSDGDLYAYAGWLYVHGADSSVIHDAHPPLGKYLVGLSILATGNQFIGSLAFGVLGLALFGYLALRLTNSVIASAIATALLSVDQTYWELSRDSLLDIYLFFFVCSGLLMFLLAIRRDRLRWWIALGIVLGLGLAIKYFARYPAVAMALIVWQRRNPALTRRALVALPVMVGTYVLSFAAFFANGKGLLDFVFEQRSMLSVLGHTNLLIKYPPLMIWPYWLLDRYLIWWPPYGFQSADYWSAMWPVTAALAAFELWIVVRRDGPGNLVAGLWLGCNVLFLSVGAVFPRYMLLIVAPTYILAASGVLELGAILWRRKQQLRVLARDSTPPPQLKLPDQDVGRV